jgi:hypothetical protein
VSQTRAAASRRRAPRGPCRGIVYGFNILDPDTREVRVDYVGQTVQRLDERERQHRGQDLSTDAAEQPWSDLIVGKPFVIEEGRWTAVELDERERFHIHRLRPRYNYEHNLANPDRIPIPVARRQREERDRARGVPTPTWDRSCRPSAASGRQRGGRPRSYRWLRSKPALLAYLWLVLATGLWLTAAHHAHGLAGAKFGTVGASLLFVAGWVVTPRRRRRRRRRR